MFGSNAGGRPPVDLRRWRLAGLVSAFGDGVADASSAQMLTDGSGAVALVGDHVVRAYAWPAWSEAVDFDRSHDVGEAGAVVDLAAGQDEPEDPPGTVASE